MRVLALSAFVLAVIGSTAAAEFVKPVVKWSGMVADAEKEAAKPKDGLIFGPKEFDTLWKAWRGDEPPPEIDFEEYFVVVTSDRRQGGFLIHLVVDAKGRGGVVSRVGQGEMKGFGYNIAVFRRDKVKTIGGKEIQMKKA